jgi:hypothetical protein
VVADHTADDDASAVEGPESRMRVVSGW